MFISKLRYYNDDLVKFKLMYPPPPLESQQFNVPNTYINFQIVHLKFFGIWETHDLLDMNNSLG